MEKKALYDLLGKYLSNTCTPEETELVDNWLEILQENKSFASYTTQDLDAIHDRIWQKIQAQTGHLQKPEIVAPHRRIITAKLIKWAVAASVIAVMVLISFRYYRHTNTTEPNSFASIIPASGMINKTNTSGAPVKLMLEDNSTIVLEPGTILHYPVHFQADKREVYLEGKALFEVSKNAKQPFFIYHNHLVTHVIGTKFIINTKRVNKEAEVVVLSGRVEVSENLKLVTASQKPKSNGVILTPNQKVIYLQDSRLFIAAIADKPIPVAGNETENFDFDNTEIGQVLQAISKEYAIDLVTENERINNCTFTGDITKLDLYSKLDIICKAINCTYEMKGTKILLKGIGCN